MAAGTLLAESLRIGSALDGLGLVGRGIERIAPHARAVGVPDAQIDWP